MKSTSKKAETKAARKKAVEEWRNRHKEEREMLDDRLDEYYSLCEENIDVVVHNIKVQMNSHQWNEEDLSKNSLLNKREVSELLKHKDLPKGKGTFKERFVLLLRAFNCSIPELLDEKQPNIKRGMPLIWFPTPDAHILSNAIMTYYNKYYDDENALQELEKFIQMVEVLYNQNEKSIGKFRNALREMPAIQAYSLEAMDNAKNGNSPKWIDFLNDSREISNKIYQAKKTMILFAEREKELTRYLCGILMDSPRMVNTICELWEVGKYSGNSVTRNWEKEIELGSIDSRIDAMLEKLTRNVELAYKRSKQKKNEIVDSERDCRLIVFEYCLEEVLRGDKYSLEKITDRSEMYCLANEFQGIPSEWLQALEDAQGFAYRLSSKVRNVIGYLYCVPIDSEKSGHFMCGIWIKGSFCEGTEIRSRKGDVELGEDSKADQ